VKNSYSVLQIPILEKNENQKYISYSQFSKWARCPRSWKLAYIDKNRKYESSIHAVFGTAMHTCLQHWIQVLYTSTIKAADAIDFETLLLEELKTAYKEECGRSNSTFSSREELAEFYADGLAILEWVRKKRKIYFDVKNEELIGTEIPILLPPDPNKSNVILMGYIDLIIKDRRTGEYIIRDIKTSGKGWNDYDKKDEIKISQLILYKKYFAQQYGIDIDKVKVEYFIVRRKIDLDSAFPQKRVQTFEPSQGKITLKKVTNHFQGFINECFNENSEYNTEKMYPAIAGVRYKNCRFCEYNNDNDCPLTSRICT